MHCTYINDFVSAFSRGLDGTVETGAMLGWKVIRQRLPDAKLVLVRRPVEDCIRSLVKAFGAAQINLPVLTQEIELRDTLLDAIAGVPGVHSLEFDELSDESRIKWLFEYCLEVPFDREHWTRLARTNIQIDLRERLQFLAGAAPRLEAFRTEVIQASNLIEGGPSWLGLN